MKWLKYMVVVALVAFAVLATIPGASAAERHGGDGSLGAVRDATARYHNVEEATDHGYAEFPDAAGIACIDNPGVGAMGIHYVNGSLLGTMDPLQPQALVYQPVEHGQLRLVALEYIAFQQPWDAAHTARPELFGQQFMLTAAGNRFGIPAFYSLHVWLWKHNPSGMFSMWNPEVHC